MIALTEMMNIIKDIIIECYVILTKVKVGCPCLSLISSPTDVVDTPFHTSVISRRDRERVFYYSHRLQSGL